MIYGHSEILKSTDAKYPFIRGECRIQSMPVGSSSFHWDNLFQDQKSNRVEIGFVLSNIVNGDYKSNPFNFTNCGISSICVYADGIPVGGNPLKLDYSAEKGPTMMRAYTIYRALSELWKMEKGCGK